MANILAQPTFSCGPDDVLATADVYKVQNTGVVNSIQSILTGYDSKLSGSLGGLNRLDVNSLTKSVLGIGTSGISANQKGIIDRVLATSPGIAGAIKSMDAEVKSVFNSAMAVGGDVVNSAMSVGNDVVSSVVDGVSSVIDVSKVFAQEQLGSLVAEITGSNFLYVNDIGAELSLYAATVKSSLDLDVSGITKDIFATISDRTLMTMLVKEISPNIIASSSARDLLGLADSYTTGGLVRATPNILKMFSNEYKNTPSNSNYSYNTRNFDYKAVPYLPDHPKFDINNPGYIPTGLDSIGSFGFNNTSRQAVTYADINKAFDATDPEWNTYTRATETGIEQCINISPIIGATSDFTDIMTVGALSSPNINDKAYLLINTLKTDTVEDALMRQYPKRSFDFENSVSRVVDPRTLM